MILANNVAGPAPAGSAAPIPPITIPVLSISLADGNALKARARRRPGERADVPRSPASSATALDNAIVAHEWGHYLHHRLVDCGITAVRRAERGLGRLHRAAMMLRDGDNLDGAYAASTYAGAGLDPNDAYFGIRRVPYSVDFTKNALTFSTSPTASRCRPARRRQPGGPNSEVHNAGEVWATMLCEVLRRAAEGARGPGQTFDDAGAGWPTTWSPACSWRRAEATFTEQRDAILAAAIAARPITTPRIPTIAGAGADSLVLAQAFARRGAGTCAISPPRFSTQPRRRDRELRRQRERGDRRRPAR